MDSSFGTLVRALLSKHIQTMWYGMKVAFQNKTFFFYLFIINLTPVVVTVTLSQMPESRTFANGITFIIATIIYFAYIITIPTFLRLSSAGMSPNLQIQSTIVGGIMKMVFRPVITLTVLFAIATPILILSAGTLLGPANIVAYAILIGLISILFHFMVTQLVLYYTIRSLLNLSSIGEVQRYILHHLSFFLFIFITYLIVSSIIYNMQLGMLPMVDTDPMASAKLPPWYVQLVIKTAWQFCIVCVDYIVICTLYVFCTQNPPDAIEIKNTPATTPSTV